MKNSLPALLCLSACLACQGAEESPFINDTTFEDFRSGSIQGSGAGLFASQDGSLRWVNWFDLNRDGWSEIVVNNDHNHYETPDAFLYQANDHGEFSSLYSPLREEMPLYQMLEQAAALDPRLTRLPSLGGGRSHVADLNADGWLDVVFCNFIHGWSEAEMPTYVYWGGEKGYSPDRQSQLNAFRGTAAASLDIDGNGLLDLVVANGGREYLINKSATPAKQDEALDPREGASYLFSQDEAGFSNARRKAIPTRFAIDVRSADFNKDGFPDLLFLEAGKPGRLRLILNGPKGLSKTPQVLPVKASTWGKITREFLVGDFDSDGWEDIFAPSEGNVSEIYWNGPGGFSEANRTELATANAYSADFADFDGDGLKDLVVANYSLRDEAERTTRYDIDSTVFYGDGKRFATQRTRSLPTSGATGVRAVDVNADGRPDIAFSQHRNDDSFDIPSVVFMNSAKGFYPGNRQFLGTFGAVDVEVLPLSPPALFFSNRQSGFGRYTGTSDATGGGQTADSLPHLGIFWGSPPAVYGSGAMTLLPAAAPETTLVCSDLDGDGFAEMVYLRGRGDELRVRFGKQGGFESERKLSLNVGFRGKSLVTADFNRDGFLDVLVTALDTPEMAFFAGTKTGFAPAKNFPLRASTQSAACGDLNADGILDLAIVGKANIQIVPGSADQVFDTERIELIETTMFSSRVCLADLNGDGQLDLFVQNFSDILATTNAVSSWVLFNDKGAFSLKRKTDIPSFGATGGSVADLNKDGLPDLVISNYHGDTTRHISLFLYYGKAAGQWSPPLRLPAYSSSANMVLDLNNDGFNDIVVFNHSESTKRAGDAFMGGVHGTGSFVYWGGSEGFATSRRSWIPSFGPHARINADTGNILNRSSQETYVSAKKTTNGFTGAAKLFIDAECVAPQGIRCEIRFDESDWTEVPLKSSGNLWTGELTIPESSSLRYRLILDSGNLGVGPTINSVLVTH